MGWPGARALAAMMVAASLVAIPAQAQVRVGAPPEAPSDALARHVRQLADEPADFNALIGAGKAALDLGDGQAAAGFFGRAEAAWPASPLPQIGIGAALAQEGDPRAALQYFAKAAQMGATASMMGADRGLAFDLLGQHGAAQADYRAALAGPDGDEARRRLALSLAITGSKADALALLAPLMARGDSAGARTRAFVLALGGDRAGARRAIEAAMPGSAAQMDYFFSRLPALRSDQKAAAVHLGLFSDDSPQQAAVASAAAPPEDRLRSIEQMLATSPPKQAAPPPAAKPQVAARRTDPPQRTSPAAAARTVRTAERRHWVQLASSANAGAMAGEFKRIKAKEPELFKGISGYVAEGEKARLLIGPFGTIRDAQTFAQGLESQRIDAFSWTSPEGQSLRKLPTE